MNVLTVRLEDIREKTAEISEQLPGAAFPVLSEMIQSGEVVLTSPVCVEITAAHEFDHVRVNGRVDAGIRLACSRCLAEYEDRIGSTFVLFYTKAQGADTDQDEEVELSETDLVSVTYRGDEIDLIPEVDEQIVMELPLKPLCSDQCRGLCSSCGTDLNLADCGCSRDAPALTFSVLKDLKINQ
jgi:uncharacterized protein